MFYIFFQHKLKYTANGGSSAHPHYSFMITFVSLGE